MSIRTEYRRCPKCGRMYPFDPDAGQFTCPQCEVSAFRWLVDRIRKRKRT